MPVDQWPPHSGITVTATGVAVSSSAAAAAATDTPSPIPTIVPVRITPRSTSAASRPTIRRVSSSGPATLGARWTASSPKRARSVSAAGLSTAVRSTIRISTMPSARARLSRRETCGRVTPSCSAIAFCVSPSS